LKKLLLSLLATSLLVAFTASPVWADSTETSVATKKRKKAKKRRAAGPGLIDRQLAKGTYGLSLGVAFGSLECDCDEAPDYERGLGFHGGVTFDKSMTRAFSVRGEGLFSSRNVTSETSVMGGDDIELELTLNYLELGGQGLLRFSASRLMSIYVLAGPYAALLMSSEARLNGKKNKDATKDLESADLGLTVGAGIFFALSNSMKLIGSLQLTYKHGLATIAGKPANKDDEIFNRAVTLNGGVHF